MKIILLGIASLISISSQASTYSCSDDRSGKVKMNLAFDGKTLVEAKVKNFPYKKFPQLLTMKKEQLKVSIGSNSEEKYRHYDFNLRQVKQGIDPVYYGSNVSFSFYYPIQKNGKPLTLDQSLVEKNYAVDGTPYGKLRLDIEFDGFTDSYGSTITFYCKKTAE